jgi:hypothetical protein
VLQPGEYVNLYDITLINRVDELVGCPGAKNCSLDRGVDDRRSPKDFASFVQDWLKNILFLCCARLNICIAILNDYTRYQAEPGNARSGGSASIVWPEAEPLDIGSQAEPGNQLTSY